MTVNEIHAPKLTPRLIEESLHLYDDRPCLVMGEVVVTYTEMRRHSSRYMQALASKGLGKGSKIAVLSGNRPEVLFSSAAATMSGCCTTALHPLGSLDDHAYILEDGGFEALIFEPTAYGDRARALADRVPGLKLLLSFGPTEGGIDYCALAAGFEPGPIRSADVKATDLHSVTYTGGTTGRPKGVRHTYGSVAYMTMVQASDWEFPEDFRFLIATPLSHAAGAIFVPALQRGGSLHVLAPFTPDGFFDMVEKSRITATLLVPSMIYPLLDSPRAATANLSSLETIFYGASPISPARLEEGLRTWGRKFFQFFGQAEAPMALTYMARADHDLEKPRRLQSCGRPSPWVEIALLDDDDQRVAPGTSGEICVRAPLVMEGYHEQPEQTAKAFANGWHHTGDVGSFDDDGFLYIVDRKKDVIITGGFNVFPREVEDVISAHPKVAQVAVIGVPDDRWGESVKALVVLRPGESGSDSLAAELKALVKDAKGSVQAPKSLEFIDAIPLSAVGKPDKKVLRNRYWSGRERAVH